MMKNAEIQIRDPFIVPVLDSKKYYMYGTTDKDCWGEKGVGFDVYVGSDLENWEGPFPVFRPDKDFWAIRNFWAPEVHSYNGKYYMFASFKKNGLPRATQILVSDSLNGPFYPHSPKPVTSSDWECLDGTLYVDKKLNPWIVFCHEWTQIKNGTVCATQLTKDLKGPIGETLELFKATDAKWVIDFNGKNDFITDGPFLYGLNGKLIMLWSSICKTGYALGIAYSESKDIFGPWKQFDIPLYDKDGGHGMLFRDFSGKLLLSIHTPNNTPNEHPIFVPVEDKINKLLNSL